MLDITLFNRFEIKMDGQPVLTNLSNTRKTKLFLSYLILNKDKIITHKELFELLWSGEDYSNPGTALRTLLYRYRAMIDASGISQLNNSIISKRGAYQWNQNLDVKIDIFEFEEYALIGLNKEVSIQKRKECLEAAIKLYKNNLLVDSSSEHWVVPKFVYYRELYIKVIIAYSDILMEEGSDGRIIEICQDALNIIGSNEKIEMGVSLAADRLKGKQDEDKIEKYEKMREYGDALEKSLNNAQHEMEVSDEVESAYVCEYSVFKDIYHLQKRLMARGGETMFLAIMMMGNASERPYDAIESEHIMEAVTGYCKRSLRCGDAICRYSDTELALLFPAGSYEDAERILERLKNGSLAICKEEEILISYKISPLKNAKE